MAMLNNQRVIYYYNAGKMMVYKGKSTYTRMIKKATPISGNLHISGQMIIIH